MDTLIHRDCYRTMKKLPKLMPDLYVTEVTLEETGRSRKILSIKFVESETMVRCVDVGCDENDRPMEKHVTYKSPGTSSGPRRSLTTVLTYTSIK